MTLLSKIMRRQTATEAKRRPLVIELHPSFITIYEKGTHHQFSAPYDAIYDLARKIAARDAK